ncbi:hypothetical protein AZI86_08860 [Bdellovibrio bacteriovorus]|uniref:FHA domain-containing protein n=1 Tax=Bdellovibrio bacteriovorus TaxID=959 RepID=A0A150WRH9_BDEBC|nr:FHA domain-containing protein [Bdellovibrio bacteriovorus]KYG67111.1 hypothetical protein AZI86_08860 [Bdellovibrio bacteriovorus]
MGAANQLKEALKFDIEVTKGPHTGMRLSFSKQIVGIGRGPENDIILSSDPRSSRKHAEIRQRDSDFVIVNLSEKNFILVNGQTVQTEILTPGSVIQIGDSEIRFNQEISQIKPDLAAVPSVFSTPTPPPMPSTPPPAPMASPKAQMPARPQVASAPAMPRPQTQNMGYGGYQPPPARPAGAGVGGGPLSNPKVRFYGIIAIIGLVGYYLFFSDSPKAKKDPNAFRTSAISMQEVAAAQKRTEEIMTTKKEKYDSVQYRRAQENFIKGFRDYQQGQYARAREAFQVVLNLDPENELAKRYYHLAKIKFDELVKFNMIQGNRYREKRNWRMCQSNYSNVMTMLQHRKDDPSYKEAKQFFEECTLNLEGGRY